MRGADDRAAGLFSHVRLEDRIAADHPLRAIRMLVEDVLEQPSGRLAGIYSHTGCPSMPPEQLLKATLLQAFFSVLSERQLMEQIDYNLLFRWFVGLEMDDRVWDASSFSKNPDRLLEADVARLRHSPFNPGAGTDHRGCDSGRVPGDRLHDSQEDRQPRRPRTDDPTIRSSPLSLRPMALQWRSNGYRGKAFIRGGRKVLRDALYMPARVAARFNPDLRQKYQALIEAGKPAKVALTAIMRKLIELANALIKHDQKWSTRLA